MKEKSFLRDVLVNILGTLIGALLSLWIAFCIYNYDGRNKCEELLNMVIYECEENQEICELIAEKLSSFEKTGSTLIAETTSLRVLSKVVNLAAESEYVSRYVPPKLRNYIYNYGEKVLINNRKIEILNNYLNNSIINKQVDYGYISSWTTILQKNMNTTTIFSKGLIEEIKLFLEHGAEYENQKRLPDNKKRENLK